MSEQSASKPARSGLSLYANLLDSSGNAPGTISGAPVTYANSKATETSGDDETAKKQQAFAGK